MGFSPDGWGLRTRESRRRVLVHARMRIGTAWVDVSIHNMSSRGMLVQTDAPPAPGTYVEIRKADHIVVGRAVWKSGRRFGIRSQDRLDIDALVGGQSAAGAASVQQGERRLRERGGAPVDAAERFERSRRLSSAMQFLVLLAAIVAAAALAAGAVRDTLSRPLDAIAGQLRGAA